MGDGPVPSKLYDILKAIKGDSFFPVDTSKYKKLIQVYNNYFIRSESDPDLDQLSESDLECLDESIKENRRLNFNTLKGKSHGQAYINASKNFEISVIDIAKEGGAKKNMIDYIKLNLENSSI